MARMPGAKWLPLPENATQSIIVPTQIIYHTAVDGPSTTSLFRFFSNRSVKVESHFYVAKSGAIEQYMDSTRRADANYGANKRGISIETWDGGDPEGTPWNAAQLDALEEITRWAAAEHDIPLQICPTHDAPGIGWHALFGFRDPMEQTGVISNPWSPSRGKTCPGKTRIHQIRDELLPRFWAEEDEKVPMNREQAEAFVAGAYKALLRQAPEDRKDDSGPEYWVNLLSTGQVSKVDFLLYFMSQAGDEMIKRENGLIDAVAKVGSFAVAHEKRIATLEASADTQAVIVEEVADMVEGAVVANIIEKLTRSED